MIKYIKRRKHAPSPPSELSAVVDNGRVKLTWKNSDDEDLIGCYVVRNRFHPPRSPMDGVKLYAGPDEYTYDDFGNPNLPKYYSVFSYDDVPNHSTPSIVMFTIDEVIPLVDEEFETQEEEEERLSRVEFENTDTFLV